MVCVAVGQKSAAVVVQLSDTGGCCCWSVSDVGGCCSSVVRCRLLLYLDTAAGLEAVAMFAVVGWQAGLSAVAMVA